MRRALHALALACALTLAPACAGMRFENPVAAAQSLDQRAYALIQTYAALVEEAADVVRDPASPLALKRALGQAEAAATPRVLALEQAAAAYLRAREDRAAAQRLNAALGAAQAPMADVQALLRARGN